MSKLTKNKKLALEKIENENTIVFLLKDSSNMNIHEQVYNTISNNFVKASELMKSFKISKKELEKIISSLRTTHLIASRPGPSGGYLAVDTKKNTYYQNFKTWITNWRASMQFSPSSII